MTEKAPEYRLLLENILDVVVVLERDGTIRYESPSVERLLGRKPSEREGHSAFEHVHPDDLPGIKSLFRDSLATPGPIKPFTFRMQHKDGHYVFLEAVGNNLLEDPEVRGAIVVLRDVTTQEMALRKLAESEEKFRKVAEIAPVAIMIHQEEFLRYVNRWTEALTGYAREELLKMKFWELVHPDHREMLRQRGVARQRGEFVPPRYEFKYVTKSGEVRWLDLSGARMEYKGKPAGLAIGFDITEQKRAEEESRKLSLQLQQAQKMESLGVMAGGIAHDFNNMLVGVLGNADMALMIPGLPAPARHRLEEIRTAAVSASEMTRQMLICAGRGHVTVEPLDLGGLVEEISGVLEASISKKAALRFNFPKGVPAVEGDAAQLRQVIMNLITNASEAIGDKSGVISISASRVAAPPGFFADALLGETLGGGDYVCLSVSDTGCGIDKETLPKIFEPFFSTRFTGRGLGLAVVMGIVKSHQGAIRVFSEPGRGSRFDLYFPASSRVPARAQEAVEAPAAKPGSGTLLCVEDDAAVREVEVAMLEGLGFSVIAAATGQEALCRFRERQAEIGAVLLDFNMPEMNGEEVFKEIRRLDGKVPVMIVSGYSETEVRQRFNEGDLAGFLKKPFRRAELVALVTRALARK